MGNNERGRNNSYNDKESNLINFDYEELKRYRRNKNNYRSSVNDDYEYDFSRYTKTNENSKYKKRHADNESYRTEHRKYNNDSDYLRYESKYDTRYSKGQRSSSYNRPEKNSRYKDDYNYTRSTKSNGNKNNNGSNNKRKKKRKKRHFGILIFIILIALFVMSTSSVYRFAKNLSGGIVNDFKSKGIPQEEIKVSIPEGSSTKEISKILEKAGLIKSAFAFNLKCKIDKISGTLKYGDFTFNTYMDFYEITKILQSDSQSSKDYVTFTVPEGYTIKQIAEKLEKENIVKAEEFLSACDNNEYSYDFVSKIPERENRLEGYLFPDTYFFSLEADSDEIINKMLTKFNTVYNNELVKRTKELNMTIDDVVKVASIIEKEVRYTEERKTVASVIYNRMKNSMKLQMDSTVLYAIGENKDRVMEEDTKIQSDYNTYYVTGLPKGPISNPGEDCIRAALYAEETDYLYYVVQNDETGQHFFTNNYDEFVAAKKKYVSKFQ